MWKKWYQRLAAGYKKQDWRFMNYGYACADRPALHNEADEESRLFIQLYQCALADVNTRGKQILEVGCGRGGGADYIARYLEPASVVGVDFAKNVIDLCNQFYKQSNLSFLEGNAEKLPLADNLFDVVVNIESSHCYRNMEAFVAEVSRVLKPGGVFVCADLRTPAAMEKLESIFKSSPLKQLAKKEITPNVLQALDEISERKKEAIEERVPSFWRSLFCEFSGVRNSQIYRGFQEGKIVYWCARFQKPF